MRNQQGKPLLKENDIIHIILSIHVVNTTVFIINNRLKMSINKILFYNMDNLY